MYVRCLPVTEAAAMLPFKLLLTLDQNSTSLLRLTNLKHDLNTNK